MKNSVSRARKWVVFLGQRSEFPARVRFLAAFEAARITRLCDCGCNSFDVEVPDAARVEPLCPQGRYGAVFELCFKTTDDQGSIEFTVFADKNGHLAGVDVDYCGNSAPVPDEPAIMEPPYHVRVSDVLDTLPK